MSCITFSYADCIDERAWVVRAIVQILIIIW